MNSKNIDRARRQAARIRQMLAIPGRDLSAMPVRGSAWTVAEQLDHTLKVATSILGILEKEKPEVLPRPCSLLGRVVLTLGYIPRGKAQSPAKLRGARASMDELRTQLSALEASIDRVAAMKVTPSTAPIVPHPIFGGLNRKQAMRLLVMHTEHHLKIVGPLAG